jgi:hypothetical protein
MFRYLADAATIRLCATGARLPVAMEADYRRLERAYLKAQPADRRGQPLLVNLEGLITNRPSAEPGRPPQRTLVVERFVGVHPGQGCPQPNPSANISSAPAPHSMAPFTAAIASWKSTGDGYGCGRPLAGGWPAGAPLFQNQLSRNLTSTGASDWNRAAFQVAAGDNGRHGPEEPQATLNISLH